MREIGTNWDRENRNTINDNFRESKNRVDNLILNTPQPSEVVDIRVDEEGTIHTTAKERIDAEALKRKNKDDELAAQLAQIVTNVKLFGAKGDGVTDDTQAFIDARTISKYLYVPEGDYVVENLSLDNAHITGKGTLIWKANATLPMLTLTGKTVIKDITLDGNKENQINDITAITLDQGRGSKLSNLKITKFRHKVLMSGVADSDYVDLKDIEVTDCGDTTGCDIFGVRSSNWIFDTVKFNGIGNGHCIRLGLFDGDSTLTPVKGAIVQNCAFENTEHNGVTCELYSQEVIIKNNYFDNLPQAIKCEREGGTVFDVIVDGNIIKNITLTTALNLSVPKVRFINNKLYNVAGDVRFGDYYDCSHNEFYDCGHPTSGVIGDQDIVYNGVIIGNLIVRPTFRGIAVDGAIIKGNRILEGTEIGIRVVQNSIITENYISGGTIGISLLSTSVNCYVNGNIGVGLNSVVSNASTDPSVIVGDNISA